MFVKNKPPQQSFNPSFNGMRDYTLTCKSLNPSSTGRGVLTLRMARHEQLIEYVLILLLVEGGF